MNIVAGRPLGQSGNESSSTSVCLNLLRSFIKAVTGLKLATDFLGVFVRRLGSHNGSKPRRFQEPRYIGSVEVVS